MMERVRLGRWVVISWVLALSSGCAWDDVVGSGQLIAEERQVSGFTQLVVNDGIDATVVVDATQPVQVYLVGDDNLVERIETRLEGSSTLRVEFARDVRWNSPNPLRVEVKVPRLEAVSGSGGGRVELSGTLSSPSLRLDTSGGGTLRANGLDVESLTLETSGGSYANLEGKAAQVTARISGGGELSARELSTREASLNSSGGGTSVLRVSDSLKVTASGGGEVRIVGRPSVLARELSGGASLTFE